MKLSHIVVLGTAVLLHPAVVSAAGNLNDAGTLLGEVGSRSGSGNVPFEQAVGSGIGIALSLVGLIFLIFMVYAGLLWITARGDESQVDKARKIISTTVIGLVITVSAYAITYFVTSRLGS